MSFNEFLEVDIGSIERKNPNAIQCIILPQKV